MALTGQFGERFQLLVRSCVKALDSASLRTIKDARLIRGQVDPVGSALLNLNIEGFHQHAGIVVLVNQVIAVGMADIEVACCVKDDSTAMSSR